MKLGRFYGGYVPDSPHKREGRADARYLLAKLKAKALDDATSLFEFAAPIEDQGSGDQGTGSCTGHGSSQGLYIAFNSLAKQAGGSPLPWVPSPDGIYKIARCAADVRPDNTVPLTDSGAMPADVMWGIGRYGIRAIRAPTSDGRYSDVEVKTVNDDPDFEDLEESGLKLAAGEYRINEKAPDVVAQVRQVLDVAKVPVGVGFQVDQAFEDYTIGSAPVGAPTGNLGGHWVCCSGYRPSIALPGQFEFEIINSWGEDNGWGDGRGCCWVTESWLKSAVFDLYAWTVRSL